jgi:hypothetical protein
MKTLKDLQNMKSDRAKVNAWLDAIGEIDEACRNEVLEHCEKDKEARMYYVGRYKVDCAKE